MTGYEEMTMMTDNFAMCLGMMGGRDMKLLNIPYWNDRIGIIDLYGECGWLTLLEMNATGTWMQLLGMMDVTHRLACCAGG